MLSTFKLVNFLSLEFGLQLIDFAEEFLDLGIHILSDCVKDHSLVCRELRLIDVGNEDLALLQASAYLIWEPGGDGGASSGSGIFGVVDDILSYHAPVLMSKFECRMNVLEHQESGFSVLHGELLHIGVYLFLA